ncbi:MAG: hypothetical protein ABIH65_01785 [Nanoarchaeota archaeon]
MSSDNTKITAILILDIIGKPREYLLESLKKIIEVMGKEKGVIIKSKEIQELTLMKDSKDFYTTFAEIEVEVENMIYLPILMFKYMPAHVEIVSPESIALKNNDFNDLLNELLRRLHGYDEIARVMQIEKKILLSKIKELGGDVSNIKLQNPQTKPEEKTKKSKNKDSKKK